MKFVKRSFNFAKERIWPSAKGGDYLSAARRRLFSAICLLIGVTGVASGVISGIGYLSNQPFVASVGVLVPLIIGILPLVIKRNWNIDKLAIGVLSILYGHLLIVVSEPQAGVAVVYLAALPLLAALLIGFRAGVLAGVVAIGSIWALTNFTVPPWLGLTTAILTFGGTFSICIFQREIERTTAFLVAAKAKVLEAKLHHQEANRLLELTLSNIEQGIVVYNADMHVAKWNKKYEELMGFPEGWLHTDRTIEDYFRFNAERGEYGPIGEQNVDETVARRMEELQFNGKDIRAHRYVRLRPNGVSIEIVGNPMPDGGLVVTLTDITDKEEARQAIEKLAWTDPLTDLLNRNSLRSTIVKSMNIVRRADKRLALLLVDLDRFKPVNDTYGHAAGDEVLRVIAARLGENIRSSDLCVSIGRR